MICVFRHEGYRGILILFPFSFPFCSIDEGFEVWEGFLQNLSKALWYIWIPFLCSIDCWFLCKFVCLIIIFDVYEYKYWIDKIYWCLMIRWEYKYWIDKICCHLMIRREHKCWIWGVLCDKMLKMSWLMFFCLSLGSWDLNSQVSELFR